ncbi:hypothetical protein HMPREF1210_01127 [Paenisporosarcina sp. HGH0030]|uniref:putative phage tail protein n=1 Tax=Paenisporosarcina sp. HGH0030 TaxID=1078085 RepID=UPI00034E4A5D|nr:putative phage tail protein [Paenisporosarcina sp. HGH0030]EPD52747.1 hypothetical protein HMPREF1210_01127 [Paenisporosarcina sp. HGH0030]
MKTVEEVKEELWKELPSFYKQIEDFVQLVHADTVVMTDIENSVDGVLEQFFLDTATWGLERWEKTFGIFVDSTKPIDQRRSVLKSKVRGTGVTTATLVKNVAESWYNGDIEVTDGPGVVGIRFNSNLGIPSNLTDVQNALREIIPAHLVIEYFFKYLLIQDINNVMTLAEVETLTLNKFAGGAV